MSDTEALCPFRQVVIDINALLYADTGAKDLVSGLNGVMFNDLMENIEWFFNLHDKNKDGYLTKDEVLTLSESLLVSASTRELALLADMMIVHFPSRNRRRLPWSSKPIHVQRI